VAHNRQKGGAKTFRGGQYVGDNKFNHSHLATFDDEVFAGWAPILKGPWRFGFDEATEGENVARAFRILKDVPPRRKQVYTMIGHVGEKEEEEKELSRSVADATRPSARADEQRWADHAAVAALQAIRVDPNPEQTLENAVAFFAKTGIWARGIGNEPGLTGCRAPPEMLAKYGLGPDGRKLPPAAPQAP
jgi:hypothetical protein